MICIYCFLYKDVQMHCVMFSISFRCLINIILFLWIWQYYIWLPIDSPQVMTSCLATIQGHHTVLQRYLQSSSKLPTAAPPWSPDCISGAVRWLPHFMALCSTPQSCDHNLQYFLLKTAFISNFQQKCSVTNSGFALQTWYPFNDEDVCLMTPFLLNDCCKRSGHIWPTLRPSWPTIIIGLIVDLIAVICYLIFVCSIYFIIYLWNFSSLIIVNIYS